MKTKMSPEEKNRLLIVISLALLSLVGVNSLWWFTTGRPYVELLRNTPKKTYSPTPGSTLDTPVRTETVDTQAAQPQGTAEERDAILGETETGSEAEPSTPDTATTPHTDTQVSEDRSVEHGHSHPEGTAEDERIRALKAETDILTQEANELLESGLAQLKETMPFFASELKKLSIEEQRTLLRQIRDGLEGSLSAEEREMLTPEILEQAWTTLFDMLAAEGYTPPEGW